MLPSVVAFTFRLSYLGTCKPDDFWLKLAVVEQDSPRAEVVYIDDSPTSILSTFISYKTTYSPKEQDLDIT